MKTEKLERHAAVREGYQILLRADAELLRFEGKPKMNAFYERTAQTCMKWAEDVRGEALRREFSALTEIAEKARFCSQRYRLRIHCPWEEGKYAVVLCESELLGQWKEPQKGYHRISHVWNTEEESILPFSQILTGFGLHLKKEKLPFHPDGIYPQGDHMVFFRNASDTFPFLEKKFSRRLKTQ